eukprot:5996087-Prorocentrum_lima.AAC.1
MGRTPAPWTDRRERPQRTPRVLQSEGCWALQHSSGQWSCAITPTTARQLRFIGMRHFEQHSLEEM